MYVYIILLIATIFFVGLIIIVKRADKKGENIEEKAVVPIVDDLELLKKMFRDKHMSDQEREKLELEYIEKKNPKINTQKVSKFIDFKSKGTTTEITTGSIDNEMTPIEEVKSKYQIVPITTKNKKVDKRKVQKLVRNMPPEVQVLVFGNVFDKKS